MVTKYKSLLFLLVVFSINVLADDANQPGPGYSQIEATEREYIINELSYRLNTGKSCKLVQKWSDQGSNANQDGYFFIPSVEDGSFIIGGYGAPSGKTSDCVITVSEPQTNPANTPALLVAPINWKSVWKDKGSGALEDGSMWEAIPPDSNYKCLGSIPQSGYKKPDLPNYRCVHVSLVEKIVANSMIWSDRGSHADNKVTMFRLPNTNSFIAVPGRVAEIETYDLKPDPVVKPDPKLVEEKLAARMEKIKQDLEASMKEEVAQKQQAEAAEQERLAEEAEQKKLAAEEEQKRLAEEAKQKQQAEAAEQKRLAEEAEQKRQAAAAEQKRLAGEAEKKKLAKAAEQKKQTAKAEQVQMPAEPAKTEVTTATDENTTPGVSNNRSSGVNSLYIYLLKVFLVVLGVFILLGFIIYKSMKGSKKQEGT